MPPPAGIPKLRRRLYEIIFEAETPAGRAFDAALLVVIVASVLAVLSESVADFRTLAADQLRALEWFFTVLFTLEYVVRLLVVQRPLRYARSFFGVVDLLSVAPTYISLLVPGAQSLLVIRALRLLRVFRIFKLARFLGEQNLLMISLRRSREKVFVFLIFVVILDLILGSAMYLIEGAASGFTSIPRSMYWAIVTMTTVGYGDIAPKTPLGQTLAAFVMILGYSIIAVPTGILTAGIVEASRAPTSTRTCPHCLRHGHEKDAAYCRHCGAKLGD